MPRRKTKRKQKLHLTEVERTLIELQNIAKAGGDHSKIAISMVAFYLRNQYFTLKQKEFIKTIMSREEAKRICTPEKKQSKYYIYAISDGVKVKIGVSTNVRSRIKALQTSNAEELNCVWKFYTGKDKAVAYKTEKKLHRACSRHKVRGEWFDIECLEIVKLFTIERE